MNILLTAFTFLYFVPLISISALCITLLLVNKDLILKSKTWKIMFFIVVFLFTLFSLLELFLGLYLHIFAIKNHAMQTIRALLTFDVYFVLLFVLLKLAKRKIEKEISPQ